MSHVTMPQPSTARARTERRERGADCAERVQRLRLLLLLPPPLLLRRQQFLQLARRRAITCRYTARGEYGAIYPYIIGARVGS
jgi:hypothetical protein